MSLTESDYQAAIARIFDSNGWVCGAGFLIAPRYLLTCAHVIQAALGVVELEPLPNLEIPVDFPQAERAPLATSFSARLLWAKLCPDIQNPQWGEDLAVLELPTAPSVKPLTLVSDAVPASDFKVWGFPDGYGHLGDWVTGQVLGLQTQGWLQLASDQPITGGFSGAPVWSPAGVIGIATASDGQRKASVISTAAIAQVWSNCVRDLGLEPIAPAVPLPLESPQGKVRIDSPFYIAAAGETRCYAEITQPGSLIRIKSPHRMGKSSLALRVQHHAQQLGYRAVTIDFNQINQKLFQDLNPFLQWFCASVGRELAIPTQIRDHWSDIFGPNDNSTDYFKTHLLQDSDRPLLLTLDNFDRIFQYPEIETDFCSLLRSWFETARSDGRWGKLRLVIVHAQEPYLARDINQSPFNVGLPIVLKAFTPEQVAELAARHGLAWMRSQLAQIQELLGGHPYLVRLALYAIATDEFSFAEFLQTAATEEGIYRSHLLGHLQALSDHPRVLAALRQVLATETPVRLTAAATFKLDSMGLVVRRGNDVAIRCLLYRLYFRDRLGC